MVARKPKPSDPVVEARFDRCSCGTTRLACRPLKRDRGFHCCPACTHEREETP